jgi:hypothetical protein
MLLGALYFYRQRSLLAWFYGQLCLDLANGGKSVAQRLNDCHSWATWLHYRTAFGCLGVAFVSYILAARSTWSGESGEWVKTHALPTIFGYSSIALCVLLAVRFVLTKYKFEEAPFACFFSNLTGSS